MKHKSSDANDHNEVGNGTEDHNHIHDPIQASDSGHNDERDQRISEEAGKRIQSERQRMKEARKNRYRPLL